MTTWTTPSRPTATPMAGRIKPGDFDYYTWDESTFTWDSTILTWDTFGIGLPPTTWVTPR